MGKRIRVQRRGKGSPTFKASTHKRVAPSKYPSLKDLHGSSTILIEDLVHDPGRGAPLLKGRLENQIVHIVAPEGVSTGQEVFLGNQAALKIGSILPLQQIPPGTIVCNLERSPGDGGKIAKASGTYASVVTHTSDGILVRLPSKRTKYFHPQCRATIGVISGAGRVMKPFVKAGNTHHWKTAKGKMYPTTKGVAMVPAYHPHGGGAHKSSSLRPTTVARTTPPGRKVGLIAARQSGRAKRRRARR
jgi:large subunit ribosomal protein L2